MKTIILSGIFFVLSLAIIGQDYQKYYQLLDEAYQLYENKEYLKSGQKYAEAFVALGNAGMIEDRYNAACSWALANENDSAFVQLFKIAIKGKYSDYNYISHDTDLNNLHQYQRWNELLGIIEQSEANLDKALVAILDTIYEDDQGCRSQYDEILNKYGMESAEMKACLKIGREKDSINQIKVQKILDEHGWLGVDKIGQEGNMALFLVIQHSELKVQEKYLPMMREAVINGNAYPSHLALLEDRVALRQGKRQIYGSQVNRDTETGEYYVMPLEDPDNVDKRREEVQLGKLQDYISTWGMYWDVEQYKKELPAIEAKEKEMQK
jgi:hypothetical protein